MIFKEFKAKWDDMLVVKNGFLNVGIIHPLNLQIGYCTSEYKSFIIMDTGILADIPSSFAIKVVNSQLTNKKWVLEFQLVHTAFEEEFLRLCWDMIQATEKSLQPLEDMISRYLKWQKFLQYTTKEVMSFQKQKGLLGELIFLEQCIEKMGCEKAIFSWSGPDGSDQDFLFSDSWAEVKSISLASEKVKISSLQQLEQEIKGNLVINILEKSTPGIDRFSLPDLVTQLTKRMINDFKALDIFEMKLFKYGYRNKDTFEYKKNYFRFVEQRTYIVDETFPKLVRNNIAQEIISCKYEISLPAIEKYRRL